MRNAKHGESIAERKRKKKSNIHVLSTSKRKRQNLKFQGAAARYANIGTLLSIFTFVNHTNINQSCCVFCANIHPWCQQCWDATK